MFFSGQLCGASPLLDEATGYLHLLRKGTLTITQPNERPLVLDTPSLVFFPRPQRHLVEGPQAEGVDLVCATVKFGVGMMNPITASLPEPFVVFLNALPELAPTLELLFSEASCQFSGRQTALDRLFEYVFVLLMRTALSERLLDSGILLGLADERLAKAIESMHKHPETLWSLEQLAHLSGMSRARFAARFRQVVGVTPFEYLTDWRLGVAQTMLRKGSPLKPIAAAVGYAHPTAFTRVFTKRFGISPSGSLARQSHEENILLVGRDAI
jgi:AraC-like DNA-binding protein